MCVFVCLLRSDSLCFACFVLCDTLSSSVCPLDVVLILLCTISSNCTCPEVWRVRFLKLAANLRDLFESPKHTSVNKINKNNRGMFKLNLICLLVKFVRSESRQTFLFTVFFISVSQLSHQTANKLQQKDVKYINSKSES